MNKKDFYNKIGLLYLIELSGGIRSRIRLQKLVCLAQFRKKDNPPFFFDYKSYYYGPYSDHLRDEIDELVRKNLLKEELVHLKGSDDSQEKFSYLYSLTERGKKFLKENLSKLKEGKIIIRKTIQDYGCRSNKTIIEEAKIVSGLESTS